VLGQARERRQMARALSDLASELSRAWGIRLNPITFTEAQVRRHVREKHPLFMAAIRDGIPLAGRPLKEVGRGA